MRGNKDDVGCVGTGVFWGFWGLESGAFLGFFAVVAKGEGAGEKRSFEPLARLFGVRRD